MNFLGSKRGKIEKRWVSEELLCCDESESETRAEKYGYWQWINGAKNRMTE